VRGISPHPWKTVSADPFLRIGALFVVGGIVWGAWETNGQSKWASKYSALASTIGLVNGFVSQIFIDRAFEIRGNSSAWINWLKLNTADDPTFPLLLFFISNSDIGPLYSKCIVGDTSPGHRISDIIGSFAYGYLNGIAAAEREMSAALFYQFILTSVRKWSYTIKDSGCP
jgi:hypothetical protein